MTAPPLPQRVPGHALHAARAALQAEIDAMLNQRNQLRADIAILRGFEADYRARISQHLEALSALVDGIAGRLRDGQP
jgi:hypothetical protein